MSSNFSLPVQAIGSALTAFFISFFFGKKFISYLSLLKIGQPLRSLQEVGILNTIHLKKQGTPTMGGILFIIAIVCSVLIWGNLKNPLIWICLFSLISFATVGFYDDWKKVKKFDSKGILIKLKFFYQVLIGCIIATFFYFFHHFGQQSEFLVIPFISNCSLNLGFGIYFLYIFIIVGTSNSVNLTDGLDGLASSISIIVGSFFGIIGFCLHSGSMFSIFPSEIAVVSFSLVGGLLGFLWWNAYPAKVFMGDTGSLAIGGLIATIAICCKQEILLAIVGGIFMVESLSVIIQVTSFKLRGKRIFKMSPIHCHFELAGLNENTIVVRATIISFLLSLIGFFLFRLNDLYK